MMDSLDTLLSLVGAGPLSAMIILGSVVIVLAILGGVPKPPYRITRRQSWALAALGALLLLTGAAPALVQSLRPAPPSASTMVDVEWVPSHGGQPGIRFTGWLPWLYLKTELETNLLPQVPSIPAGSTVKLADLGSQRDLIVEVIDPSGRSIANVWLGRDPTQSDWPVDGLVRVGSGTPPAVLGAFQRGLDGSYHKQ